MNTLLALTLSGSVLALLLLSLRYFVLRKMPSTVYYYAWLLVLLRFALPLPGLIPAVGEIAPPEAPAAHEAVAPDSWEQTPLFSPRDASLAALPAASAEEQDALSSGEAPEQQDRQQRRYEQNRTECSGSSVVRVDADFSVHGNRHGDRFSRIENH